MSDNDKEIILIRNDNNKVVFSIKKTKKDDKFFFQLKDYGAKTYRDLFYQIYGDAPTKNKAILEIRNINNLHKLQ